MDSKRNVTRFSITEDGKDFLYPNPRFMKPSTRDHSYVADFKSSMKVLGWYSEDKEGKIQHDLSSITYIDKNFVPDSFDRQKIVNFDLSVSEKKAEKFTKTNRQRFLNFLHWIIANEEKVKDAFSLTEEREKEELGPDIVCVKDTLNEIILIPYTYNQDLKIYAASCNGSIYIVKELTAGDLMCPDNVSSWAHKFKQYMCGEEPDTPALPNKCLRGVISVDIGPFRVMYAAATDSADRDLFKENSHDFSAFVKLKCINDWVQTSGVKFIDQKLVFLYHHCLLTGTPRVIIGFRNNSVISRIKMFTENDLLASSQGRYDPATTLAYAVRTFSFIKDRTESDPGAVFSFTKNAYESRIRCEKVGDLGPMLPPWFEQRHQKE